MVKGKLNVLLLLIMVTIIPDCGKNGNYYLVLVIVSTVDALKIRHPNYSAPSRALIDIGKQAKIFKEKFPIFSAA